MPTSIYVLRKARKYPLNSRKKILKEPAAHFNHKINLVLVSLHAISLQPDQKLTWHIGLLYNEKVSNNLCTIPIIKSQVVLYLVFGILNTLLEIDSRCIWVPKR